MSLLSSCWVVDLGLVFCCVLRGGCVLYVITLMVRWLDVLFNLWLGVGCLLFVVLPWLVGVGFG